MQSISAFIAYFFSLTLFSDNNIQCILKLAECSDPKMSFKFNIILEKEGKNNWDVADFLLNKKWNEVRC